jgi:hypothetical protein
MGDHRWSHRRFHRQVDFAVAHNPQGFVLTTVLGIVGSGDAAESVARST